MDQVYYIVASANAAGAKIDAAAVVKLLAGFIAKESNPSG